MRILFTTVPRIIYTKSMNNRATDFGETIAYVKNKCEGKNIEIDILDVSVSQITTLRIYKQFAKNYDLVVFYVDIPDSPMVKKLAQRLKYISPKTNVFVYGDSCLAMPQYFNRKPFDAYHVKGDQEYAIYSYINYLKDGKNDTSFLAGVVIRLNDKYVECGEPVWLRGDEWALPPIDMLPIDQYQYFCEMNKGKSYKISVYVSKGCSKGCKYCMCSPREGSVDRRRPVPQLIDFIEKYKDYTDMFKFHSANFFADREWSIKFMEELIKRKIGIKWRAVTEFQSLDEEIIRLSHKAGCVEIAFGVETFYVNEYQGVKININHLRNLLNDVKDIPMMYKGYVMLGLNNQSLEDINYTIDVLNELGIKIRASTYTPFQLLKCKSIDELDNIPIQMWDKKEFISNSSSSIISEEEIYKLLTRLTFENNYEEISNELS